MAQFSTLPQNEILVHKNTSEFLFLTVIVITILLFKNRAVGLEHFDIIRVEPSALGAVSVARTLWPNVCTFAILSCCSLSVEASVGRRYSGEPYWSLILFSFLSLLSCVCTKMPDGCCVQILESFTSEAKVSLSF